MTDTAAPAFSKSEMMIVAAARELAGQHVCFVGVGLPNIAVNLAKRTVAPDLELVYEAGVFGARPARLPLSIGDPTIVTGATAVVSMFELFAFYLQRGLIDVGFLGRGPDRPLRQHQHDGHRRLRRAEDPAAGLRRRLRDRDQRAPGVRDHAPVDPLVRRADRLPDLARQPRRGGERRADPPGRRLERARAVGGGHGPRHLALRRDGRDAPGLAAPGRDARGGPRDDRLGAEGQPTTSRRRPPRPRRSCASSARSSIRRASTRSSRAGPAPSGRGRRARWGAASGDGASAARAPAAGPRGPGTARCGRRARTRCRGTAARPRRGRGCRRGPCPRARPRRPTRSGRPGRPSTRGTTPRRPSRARARRAPGPAARAARGPGRRGRGTARRAGAASPGRSPRRRAAPRRAATRGRTPAPSRTRTPRDRSVARSSFMPDAARSRADPRARAPPATATS